MYVLCNNIHKISCTPTTKVYVLTCMFFVTTYIRYHVHLQQRFTSKRCDPRSISNISCCKHPISSQHMCTYSLTTHVCLHLRSYLHAYSCLVFAHCQQHHPLECTYIKIHTFVCKFPYNMYVATSRLISSCIFWPRRAS